MKLIAFSGRARSGKTAMAKWLESKYHYKIYTIAKYLKELCMDLISVKDPKEFDELKINNASIDWHFNESEWVKKISKRTGIAPELIEVVLQSRKDDIKTVRDLLQIVGTDIIRVYSPNWHIDECIKEIKSDKCELAVIDDCRFPNEKKAIEELGGTVYFICRPEKLDGISNHKSETALKWRDFPESQVLVNIENEDERSVPMILTDYFEKTILGDDIYILNQDNYEQGVTIDSWFKTNEDARSGNYRKIIPYLVIKNGYILFTVSDNTIKDLTWSIFGVNKPIDKDKLVRVNDPFIVEDLKEYIDEKGNFYIEE